MTRTVQLTQEDKDRILALTQAGDLPAALTIMLENIPDFDDGPKDKKPPGCCPSCGRRLRRLDEGTSIERQVCDLHTDRFWPESTEFDWDVYRAGES